MPIVAYQSFNANVSTTHDFNSMKFQRFTKDTNAHMTGQGNDVLEYPTNRAILDVPIEGPAYKRPISRLESDQHTVGVFGSHICQMWQHFVRQFGRMPDLMVIGEMDSSHQDFKTMVSGDNLRFDAFPNAKACQSFSAICQNPEGGRVTAVAAGVGYVVYSVADLNMVFVHVPNEIATNQPAMQKFYSQIANELTRGGKVIHVVLGDTNQQRPNFTADVLNAAFGVTTYQTAALSASPVDVYQGVAGGTNSNASKMYDVAVYRSDVLELKKIAYISQSATSVTVTDHAGLGIHVERKG
jgi:hypothetical protein